MDDQLLSLVFVNGEWVTRSMDINHIISRSRQQEDTVMGEPELQQQHDTTRLGILSKTVLASPHVKFIIPANIRQKKFNDVVFVGEDFVHLKEARANGPLRHVATKSDFKGRILAARVFGNPRRAEVKPEHGTPIKRKDVHAQRRSTIGEEADFLPPEVIVLTLDSRTLMFLWAQQTSTGCVKFCHRTLRLPVGSSRLHRTGHFLAVDPKCRAIAVSALEGQFIFYRAKSMERWREDIRSGRDSMLVEDERIFDLQGRIMHMEFLTSGVEEDDTHVILAFVIAHEGKTKITCYDWDTRCNLDTVTARTERVNVDFEDHNPSLFIPLSRSPDFFLVFDRHISTYENILSGTASRRYKVPMPDEILGWLRPGDSNSYPSWVQWHGVARNVDYGKEVFYIAREDGKIMFAEVGLTKIPEISDAGHLPHAIDTAFASLDVDAGPLNRLQPDVLVAAGVTSDGCLSKVGAWVCQGINMPYLENNVFAHVEAIPNWAPIADLAITPRAKGIGPLHEERESIFIANGRAPHGTVTELRRGINAPIDHISGRGWKGCTGLSIMDHGCEETVDQGKQVTQYYAVLLVNLPPQTLVVRMLRVNGFWGAEDTPESQHQDAILADETLSAGMLSARFSVQITRAEARILDRKDSLGHVDSLIFANPVSAAAITTHINYIAAAYRENNRSFIQAIEICEDGRFGSKICYELSCDPTYVEIMDIQGVPYILVGTTDSMLHFIRVSSSTSTLELVHQHSLRTENGSQSMATVCESAVLLSFRDERIVLCGTRDGMLVSFCLSDSPSGVQIELTSRVQMGTTAVRLTRSATDSSVAFVSCGSDFCRVHHQRGNSAAVIDSIWFTDKENVDYQQHSVTTVEQLPLNKLEEDPDHDTAGFMFAVCGDVIVMARLDYDIGCPRSPLLTESKAVPRKTVTKATPTKLLYSKDLGKIIVATTEATEVRAPPNGYRTIRSVIQLIQVSDDEASIKQEDIAEEYKPQTIVAEYALRNYERIYSMIEWVTTDKRGRPYHFIFVGTGITKGKGSETGRRLILQVVGDTIEVKNHKDFDQPVRCMGLWDEKRLFSVVGTSLFQELYVENKWVKDGESQRLPSVGVHLTIAKPFIYVSTAKHSHICYEISNEIGPFLSRSFTDNRERALTHHTKVALDLGTQISERAAISSMDVDSDEKQPTARPATIILLADKTCNVTGLLQPPQRMVTSNAETTFEAHLPRSVTRLQRGNIRPPWRRPISKSRPKGVHVDDIIGTCTDGTVYAFSILSDQALCLLKFIQNLIENKEFRLSSNQHSTIPKRSKSTSRLTVNGSSGNQSASLISLREVDPTEGIPAPKRCHVDADVILRFLDGESCAPFSDDQDRLLDLVSVGVEAAVGKEFVNLAAGLGFKAGHGPGMEREMARMVAGWMREVTMDLL